MNKWIESLRSDKYTQGRGGLFSHLDGTFCCLGVLGNINCRSIDYMSSKNVYWPGIGFDGEKNEEDDYPEYVQALYILNDGGGSVDINDPYISTGEALAFKLYEDTFGKKWNCKQCSFEQIADILEKNREVFLDHE